MCNKFMIKGGGRDGGRDGGGLGEQGAGGGGGEGKEEAERARKEKRPFFHFVHRLISACEKKPFFRLKLSF